MARVRKAGERGTEGVRSNSEISGIKTNENNRA